MYQTGQGILLDMLYSSLRSILVAPGSSCWHEQRRAFSQLSNSARKQLEKQQRGFKSFTEYYSSVYGDRWPQLLHSLRQPTRYAALLNRWIGDGNETKVRRAFESIGAQPSPFTPRIPCFLLPPSSSASATNPVQESLPASPPATKQKSPHASSFDVDDNDEEPTDLRFPSPLSFVHSLRLSPPSDSPIPLLPYYPLDLASVLAVQAMDLKGHEQVFDMCAAPGGKSLVLSQLLQFQATTGPTKTPTPSLQANDISSARKARLHRVLRSYLPSALVSDPNIFQVTQKDVTMQKMEWNKFDVVLLDAPCSTDRHMLQQQQRQSSSSSSTPVTTPVDAVAAENDPAFYSNPEWSEWSPARFRRDQGRQVELLLQALRCVKVNGVVLYATCSLSPRENDEVIDLVAAQCEKWLRKQKSSLAGEQIQFKVENEAISKLVPIGEATKNGWIILPDQLTPGSKEPHGFGPIYMSRLRRVEPSDMNVETSKATKKSRSSQSIVRLNIS